MKMLDLPSWWANLTKSRVHHASDSNATVVGSNGKIQTLEGLSAAEGPWPSFRGNPSNTAHFPQNTVTSPNPKAVLWTFQTKRGIFSVPAIASDGTIFIGSADHTFYALNGATGKQKWSIHTGEIIDSAAAIYKDRVVFGSGDGHLYNVLASNGKVQWKFAAHHSGEPGGGESTWFEGQVQIDPRDGQIFIGNDDYRFYSLDASGKEIFSYHPGPFPYGTTWSGAAIMQNGDAIATAMNGRYYRIDKKGNVKWHHEALFSISAAVVLHPTRELAFFGTWGGIFRAINTENGNEEWKFDVNEEIYGAAALDSTNETIFFGALDGIFYALDTVTGDVKWKYAVNYPIRSSPALANDAIYFGAANGILYCLDPVTGKLIWGYDTTEDVDHRELNASPGLGKDSVVIGSEDGRIISIPYGYCLDPKNKENPRCHTNDDKLVINGNGKVMLYVSPGGAMTPEIPSPFPISGSFHIKMLIVREGNVKNTNVLIPSAELEPRTVELSVHEVAPEGNFIITPQGFLTPNTSYFLKVSVMDTHLGLTEKSFSFKTPFAVEPGSGNRFVPKIPAACNEVSAYYLYNLKPSYPPAWISLNQIGFDSVNALLSVVHKLNDQKYIVWILGGILNPDKTVSIDKATTTIAPGILTLDESGTSFILDTNLEVVTGGPPIPLTNLQVRSQFDKKDATFGMSGNTAWMSWNSVAGTNLSSLLGAVQTGLIASSGRIVTTGSFRGSPYTNPAAVKKPIGWTVTQVTGSDGLEVAVTAHVKAPNAAAAKAAVLAILVIDEVQGVPVYLKNKHLKEVVKEDGTIQLNLSFARCKMSIADDHIRVLVMCDMFPIFNDMIKV
ncbi:quinon protein alcohol dehydrogenase-like superfamily [Obelidium mucronatum]|nr:quinon protein alcohol dehydrogenase-like superfamily [Obelidium mucronatum]